MSQSISKFIGIFLLILAGCSRCRREDPKPKIKFDIISFQYIDGIYIGDSVKYANYTYTDTSNLFVSNGGNAFYLQATDSTWDEYFWHFAFATHVNPGQVDQGRTLKLSSFPLGSDTAYLTAYRHNRKDTATAKYFFKSGTVRDLNLIGDYKGSYTFNGSTYPDAILQLVYIDNDVRECGRSTRQAIYLHGLYTPCGGPDLASACSSPASRKDLTFTSLFGYSSLPDSALNHPSCGLSATAGGCDAIFYAYGQVNQDDTLKLSGYYSDRGIGGNTQFTIFFKGKKQ